jgi:DNA-binding SARP family transcriptional activator
LTLLATNGHLLIDGPAEPTLRVACLGTFRMAGFGEWDDGPPARRARELLQYLVLHPKTTAPRERLIDLLWPDVGSDVVAHRLHLAASAVRASVRGVLGGFDALRWSAAGYTWHPSLRIVSDAATFNALYHGGSVQAWSDAVALYAGELLCGEQGEWLQPLRMKYAAMHASMLERLADGAFAERRFEEALHFGLELLGADRAHEGASRLVMRCFAALGRRSQAAIEYEALCAYVRKHLGVEPMHETQALIRTIMGEDSLDTAPQRR